MKFIYPLDSHGFVQWHSEQYRVFIPGEQLAENEISVPIPPDNGGLPWYKPQWDGMNWVEGVDHPNAPIPNSMQLGGLMI